MAFRFGNIVGNILRDPAASDKSLQFDFSGAESNTRTTVVMPALGRIITIPEATGTLIADTTLSAILGANPIESLQLVNGEAGPVTLAAAADSNVYTFTFPNDVGIDGQALVTDGTGATRWASVVTSYNLITVDGTYGNDETGAKGGSAFATITAALAAASSGDTVEVMPGTYDETITIPSGVRLHGLVRNSVIIRAADPVLDAVVITMGASCYVENLSITGNTSGGIALTGILFSDGTSATSFVRDVSIIFDIADATGIGVDINDDSIGFDTWHYALDNVFIKLNRTGMMDHLSYGIRSISNGGVFQARRVDTGADTSSIYLDNSASITLYDSTWAGSIPTNASDGQLIFKESASTLTFIDADQKLNLIAPSGLISYDLILPAAAPSASNVLQCTGDGTTLQWAPIVVSQNIINVDPVYGTAEGSKGGSPLDTIANAIAIAADGDVIMLYPGTYDEVFTIPDGVTVRGIDKSRCTIVNTGISNSIVHLGDRSVLDNLTINAHMDDDSGKNGVEFDDNDPVTAVIRNCRIIVISNMGSMDAIRFGGMGSTEFGGMNIIDSEIMIFGDGSNPAYGINSYGGGTLTGTNLYIMPVNASAVGTSNGSTVNLTKSYTVGGIPATLDGSITMKDTVTELSIGAAGFSVSLFASGEMPDNYSLAFPVDPGQNGQALLTDGAQSLYWDFLGGITFDSVAIVDPNTGSDGTGSLGGSPFGSIQGAIDAASGPGGLVLVMPGTYEETLDIPDGVHVKGISRKLVVISGTERDTSYDLITLHQGGVLESVSLYIINEVNEIDVRGIVIPDDDSSRSRIYDVGMRLIQSTANGSMIGIYYTSAGNTEPSDGFYHAENVGISYSKNHLEGYGLQIDGADSHYKFKNIRIIANDASSGDATIYGLYITATGSTIRIDSSELSGTTADVNNNTTDTFLLMGPDVILTNSTWMSSFVATYSLRNLYVGGKVMTFANGGTLNNAETRTLAFGGGFDMSGTVTYTIGTNMLIVYIDVIMSSLPSGTFHIDITRNGSTTITVTPSGAQYGVFDVQFPIVAGDSLCVSYYGTFSGGSGITVQLWYM
jgi:hypothetical protein